MSDDLSKLLRESFEYNMTNVHTAFPGTVEKYDPATRRADIQPYLKRKLPNGEFMDFPIIPDVPVLFFGTINCTIHAPLEKDDEVLMMVCERATDQWRDNGGKGVEDTDPRRFNLMDCFAIPGLQPKKFQKTPETGISIIYKEKQKILIDDDTITIENGTSKAVLNKDDILLDNGTSQAELKGGKITVTDGGDKITAEGGKIDVEATTKITIKATAVEITGGQFTMKGQVTPGTGPLCAIPACLFTGAPHGGNISVGT
jgi:hypothetical protein